MVLTVIISIRYSRRLQWDRQCHAPQGHLADLTDLGEERGLLQQKVEQGLAYC